MLDGDVVAARPARPGARSRGAGVVVELGAQLPGALPPPPSRAEPIAAHEIRDLVANVRARITPDLGATPTSRATPSRDRRRLHDVRARLRRARHRAAESRRASSPACASTAIASSAIAGRCRWTGRAWIAVDAAFGAVPAGGDLVGLAVHDADDAGLVAGEAALTHVRAATWN